ncbi:hypothetical protein [Saccharothrix sp. ALI-22-I]|uniref:hypothetical protein n=1 Tax=Saccharothrix sp. ALI-22-I TaxID=1933778 RepID=UPI00117A5DCC|nr:hypothetical protein [Saccharothrix sp. ALI-22-I]
MSASTRRPARVGIVVIAPVVLLTALSYHPHLPGRQPNLDAVASAVELDPSRWAVAHLGAGVAFGLLSLAFLAVRGYLREAGEDRWSAAALPFVIIGNTLYAMLPGMEFAPLAAVETGGSARAAQEALVPWFVPLLIVGALAFGVGVLGMARGVARSRVLSTGLTRLVVVAFVVMALSRFVPLSAVQFHVQGVAGLAALLPLAYAMAKQPHHAGEPVSRERNHHLSS